MQGSKLFVPIAIPPGTKALRLVREAIKRCGMPDCGNRRCYDGRWILWIHTNDFVHGTFLRMYDDGLIERVTVRAEEGDEIVIIKPRDEI